jgi:hypothetical protein
MQSHIKLPCTFSSSSQTDLKNYCTLFTCFAVHPEKRPTKTVLGYSWHFAFEAPKAGCVTWRQVLYKGASGSAGGGRESVTKGLDFHKGN